MKLRSGLSITIIYKKGVYQIKSSTNKKFKIHVFRIEIVIIKLITMVVKIAIKIIIMITKNEKIIKMKTITLVTYIVILILACNK